MNKKFTLTLGYFLEQNFNEICKVLFYCLIICSPYIIGYIAMLTSIDFSFLNDNTNHALAQAIFYIEKPINYFPVWDTIFIGLFLTIIIVLIGLIIYGLHYWFKNNWLEASIRANNEIKGG